MLKNKNCGRGLRDIGLEGGKWGKGNYELAVQNVMLGEIEGRGGRGRGMGRGKSKGEWQTLPLFKQSFPLQSAEVLHCLDGQTYEVCSGK